MLMNVVANNKLCESVLRQVGKFRKGLRKHRNFRPKSHRTEEAVSIILQLQYDAFIFFVTD
jgi:hypothetical protein